MEGSIVASLARQGKTTEPRVFQQRCIKRQVMLLTFLLWIVAAAGLLAVAAVLWIRAVVHQLRREQELFYGLVTDVHPGPIPRIVASRRVRELREGLEKRGFSFLGYSCNLTKHALGRKNVCLVFAAVDGKVTAAVTCMIWPRRLFHLNIPCALQTGRWMVNISLETACEGNYWISTLALNDNGYGQQESKQNFQISYLGDSASVDELYRHHYEQLQKHDQPSISPILTMDDYVKNQRRIHEFLAQESRRQFEQIIDEAREHWPVAIDQDRS